MITHEILFKHYGENADTAKAPIAVWTGQVDLNEEKVCCRNWDDNGLTTVKMYAVMEVELPIWLTPDEWIRNEIDFRFSFSYVGKEAPEALVRWFAYGKLDEARKNAIVKLLGTVNFRSDFRRSLRDQIATWLDTPSDERKYDSPLSPKQWSALVTVHDLPRGDKRRFRSY